MSKAYCDVGDHYPDEILAATPHLEIGVIQNNDGSNTNRYADGTVGVSEADGIEAQTDDEPICVQHPDCYITWDHDDE